MKKIIARYKGQIIVAAMVLAVVLAIYLIGRKAGKRDATNPWTADLPDDAGGEVNPAKVRAITDDLYADLEKLDVIPMWGTRNTEPYKRWNSLSDTEFTAVYNDFNARFSSKFGSKSIRVILKNEWGWGSSDFNALRDSIEARFERLNLV
jgi:hypothetical protein